MDYEKRKIFTGIIAKIIAYTNEQEDDACEICNSPGIKIVVSQDDTVQPTYDSNVISYEFVVLCPVHAFEVMRVIKNVDDVLDSTMEECDKE